MDHHHRHNDVTSGCHDADDADDADDMMMISAASSALMGENILDSPKAHASHSPPRRHNKRFFPTTITTQTQTTTTTTTTISTSPLHHQEASSSSNTSQQRFPDLPNLNPPDSVKKLDHTENHDCDDNDYNDTTNYNKNNSASQPHLDATNHSNMGIHNQNNTYDGRSVGVVAQGWSWAKNQRNQRQRRYLQYQAEQQLLKLQLAATSTLLTSSTTTTTADSSEPSNQPPPPPQEREQPNNNNEKTNGSSLFFDSTSLQSWIQSLTLSTPDEHMNVVADQTLNSFTSHSSSSHDDRGEYHNNAAEPHGSSSDHHQQQVCHVSQSGCGYSVALPILFQHSSSTFPLSSTPATGATSISAIDNNNNNSSINSTDGEDDNDTSWIPQVRVEDATAYNNNDYDDTIQSDHSNDEDGTPKTRSGALQSDHHRQQQDSNTGTVCQDGVDGPNNATISQARPPYLLSSDEMYQIAVHVLPRNIVYSKWKRYYSLVRDGDSFDNCLRQVQHCKQSLLIIRTTKNYRFGTYVDAPWDTTHSQHHGTVQYYGGPETCLFKIVDDDSNGDDRHNPDTDRTENHVTSTLQNSDNSRRSCSKVICYKWSGMNRYIQLCDHQNKMIAIGGGNGTFGLCIQQDFQYGSTGACTTFQNEALCPDEQFSILDVEIYGFLLGQF